MRRSLNDPAWADQVFQRYQRRRDLPYRRLRSAFDDVFLSISDWIVGHQRITAWVLTVYGGVAIGLVIGLTILGWYEVR